jgi:transcriptional regulator with XRE-family HTH domain
MSKRPSPLRLARISSGLRLHDLSRRSKIGTSKLSMIERGLIVPHAHEITTLARVFGVRPSALFPKAA